MNPALFHRLRSPWLWLALGLVAVYLRGLFLDVMDVDAAQYASISMEMLQNSHSSAWLQVQHRGADYLDKPPLVFWLSASSFWLFSLSNWAYKLPSLLAALAGVCATYRFAFLFYGEKTARLATTILASCMGLMVICNDVRTDTILLGFAACAVWQLAEYVEFNRWRNLLAGFFFIGLAMLAKGPIGLVMPAFAVGGHLLVRRDWRGIFRWQWLLGLAVTAMVLAPMCWGLWQQFDLRPEKLVNERQGVSGLRFFFWEQSFGRITGENVWRNDASVFYFLHVYLWAFLPWCLLLPAAIWLRVRGFYKGIIPNLSRLAAARHTVQHPIEYYSLAGFLLTFVALSMAQYKLPHYIFITLPWAAALVACSWQKTGVWLWTALYISAFVALFIAFTTLVFVFPTGNVWVWGIVLAATGGLLWKIFRNPFPSDFEVLVQRGAWVAVVFGFVLNFHFYPNLLPYQCSAQAAQWARAKGIPPEKMYFFNGGSHSLDFYNGDIMENLDAPEKVVATAREQGGIWVFATEAGKTELEDAGIKTEQAGQFRRFQVALLKPKFLNPATRGETLGEYFLLHILQEQAPKQN